MYMVWYSVSYNIPRAQLLSKHNITGGRGPPRSQPQKFSKPVSLL